MFDMAGRVTDIVGNGLHGVRSTGQRVAKSLNTAAIADSSDSLKTAGTGHPNMDRSSRNRMVVPEGWGRLRQVVQKVQLPTNTLSSD